MSDKLPLPIQRTLPRTPITRPEQAVPAVARLRWQDGNDWKEPAAVDVLMLAWSGEAVQIDWRHEGKHQIDWIAIDDARRLCDPRSPSDG